MGSFNLIIYKEICAMINLINFEIPFVILKNYFINKFRNKIEIIDKFMSKENINPELQLKIKKYLKNACKAELLKNDNEETRIISMLSKKLKDELVIESNKKIIENYSFFKKFSNKTNSKLSLLIKKRSVFSEEIIFLVKILKKLKFIIKRKEKKKIYHFILSMKVNLNYIFPRMKE